MPEVCVTRQRRDTQGQTTENRMRDVPHIEPSSYIHTEQRLRFLARDAQNPCAAIVYWLGATKPSRQPSFFVAMKKFGGLMQLFLPDERLGVFVNRDAVH